MTINAFLEAAKIHRQDATEVTDEALAYHARNAAKEIEELRDLYHEYFDARSMPTPERRAQIVDRIREIVGGGE